MGGITESDLEEIDEMNTGDDAPQEVDDPALSRERGGDGSGG